MPKKVIALSDVAVRTAKPRDKQYKLADGAGMYLLIMPDGAKYWRMGYRFGGKEKTLAFGKYPEVTLAGEEIDLEEHEILLEVLLPCQKLLEEVEEIDSVVEHSIRIALSTGNLDLLRSCYYDLGLNWQWFLDGRQKRLFERRNIPIRALKTPR